MRRVCAQPGHDAHAHTNGRLPPHGVLVRRGEADCISEPRHNNQAPPPSREASGDAQTQGDYMRPLPPWANGPVGPNWQATLDQIRNLPERRQRRTRGAS